MALASNYNPKEYEDSIYKQWIQANVGSPQIQEKIQAKPLHLIFDFDGVIGDTYHQVAAANKVLVGHSDIQTSYKWIANYYSKKTQHGKDKTKEEIAIWIEFFVKTGEMLLASNFNLFEDFVVEIAKIKNAKLAVVSSGTKNYINPALAKTKLDFTHVLGFEEHHSKEQKIAQICQDWGVDKNQVYYFTDTKTDVWELENYLDFKKIIGCSWGYQGYDLLLEVLPQDQILQKPTDLHTVLSSKNTHTIIMPPPNLTGDLHAGHAFGHYLQDTITRIYRQKGDSSLWYPGVDHAGLQLEGVIDKLIRKGQFDQVIEQEIQSKSQLGELKNSPFSKGVAPQVTGYVPEFPIDKADLPKWLKQNHPDIWTKLAWSKVNLWRDNQKNQAKILGDTPDYSRNLFTLDNRANRMVTAAFEQYYKDGLVYKGAYLINWSVGLQTALSDVAGEIEFEQRVDPFVTFEYEVKEYKLSNPKLNRSDFQTFLHDYLLPLKLWPRLKLSTVRPETKFTDLAVAMHPSKADEYFNLDIFDKDKVGFDEKLAKEFIEEVKTYGVEIFYHLPPLESEELKLILSDKVDPNFGTGILKITPAHDIFDYNLYQEFVEKGVLEAGKIQTSIGRDGKLTEVCGEYAGLTVEQGRLAVIKKLAETGYIPVKNDLSDYIKYLEVENSPFSKGVAPKLAGYVSSLNESPDLNDLKTQILAEVKLNLESEYFNPTDFSYNEGIKRLQEIMGEAGKNLQIDWGYIHNVSVCERTKTVIEPLISEEFFLSYEREFDYNGGVMKNEIEINENSSRTNLQQLGLQGVKETKYFSGDYQQRAENFLENIKDWCISRDLVWGHKFPVWYNLDLNPEKIFYSYKEIQANPDLNRYFQIGEYMPEKYGNWIQEEKILDTWFSSCLWPLTTLDFYDSWKGQKVIIVHGSPETKKDYEISSRHWFPALKKELENIGLEVYTPEMPNSEHPNYEEWKNVVESLPIDIDEHTILIGHSAGGAFLARYISESRLTVKQLVLVSASKTKLPSNVRLHDLLDFKIDPDIASLNIPTTVITSKDEPKYRHENAEEYAKLFATEVVYFENYGHFTQDDMGKTDFPELLDLLLIQNDFKKYYPTQELITAGDIFYTWVVRMTVLGKYFTGKIPFETVVITPTVRDEQGRKMSKSLGNGLDAVETIEKFSSDALRLAMLSGMIPNRNFRLGGAIADKMCEKYRNFGNKLWNVARFLESQG